ncbi:MAG: hypothetical protein JO054_03495 [Actinobacteria bacterium]|nr:hypothetical protein [Actinomycetota bacterium]MBV9253275.1 hypothetical protein [Actinomycetota bacterium]
MTRGSRLGLLMAVVSLVAGLAPHVARAADLPDPTDPASVVKAIPQVPPDAVPRTNPVTDATGLAGCDGRDRTECLFPFPNDRFTVADRGTATGRRVNLPLLAMPRNIAGKPIDPSELNRNDGFSPGSMILTVVPGVDLGKTGAAPITDMARSLDPDQPIVVLNTRTGKRHPFWAELDSNATNPARRALIIRPAVNFDEGTRYVVALRRMRDAKGHLIPPSPAFRAERDARKGTAGHMESVFASLDNAGVNRRDLFLAWDFTVASRQNLTGRLLHIRDDAFASLHGGAPSFTVDTVSDFTPAQNHALLRQVHGSFTVPNYLNTPTGSTGSRFNYLGSKDGLPTRLGGTATLTAKYTCNISRAAATKPARPSLYGHGLLGSQDEVNAGNVQTMAATQDFMFCATDWIGMATEDLPTVGSILVDVSNFPALADRSQQGILDFLFLARLMKDPRAFASNAAFRANGRSLIDTSAVYYDGNSQGGIMGGALMAVAQDITRGVLGVPGMNYSTLLNRSVDFATYSAVMYNAYPDKLDQQLVFALMQMLWDRAEADGYALHMTTRPLPNTPAHTILMTPAVGDHQVANVAAEVEARTIGAAVHWPAVGAGRSFDVTPFWGIARIPAYPYRGSAIVMWDSHKTPVAPTGNVPPSAGQDPHEYPRAQAADQAMKSAFLQPDGAVVDTCAGKPC